MTDSRAPIAVVGSGSIGVSWAIVFARAGHTVYLHDTDAARLSVALREFADRANELGRADLLDEDPMEIAGRVGAQGRLQDAVATAAHVQECVPEDVASKQSMFAMVEQAAGPDTFSQAPRQRCCRRSSSAN